jgi:hypothetical protein
MFINISAAQCFKILSMEMLNKSSVRGELRANGLAQWCFPIAMSHYLLNRQKEDQQKVCWPSLNKRTSYRSKYIFAGLILQNW